jgi:hypothetical protein
MDLVFGTYQPPTQAQLPMRVGLPGTAVFPTDFLSHLTMPFRRDPVGLDGNGVSA